MAGERDRERSVCPILVPVVVYDVPEHIVVEQEKEGESKSRKLKVERRLESRKKAHKNQPVPTTHAHTTVYIANVYTCVQIG